MRVMWVCKMSIGILIIFIYQFRIYIRVYIIYNLLIIFINIEFGRFSEYFIDQVTRTAKLDTADFIELLENHPKQGFLNNAMNPNNNNQKNQNV